MPQRAAPRVPTASRRLVLLLSAALFINYVDRGNLSTAAPLIQDELHLSATQLGFLLSAFYYSYVLAMAPVGWLAERSGTRQRARPRGLDVDSAAGRTGSVPNSGYRHRTGLPW